MEAEVWTKDLQKKVSYIVIGGDGSIVGICFWMSNKSALDKGFKKFTSVPKFMLLLSSSLPPRKKEEETVDENEYRDMREIHVL